MRRRGITLVELLLALMISTLVMVAAGSTYIYAARTQQTLGNGRDALAKQAQFEAKLTDLFNHVYIDADATNLNTYFMSGDAVTSLGSSTTSTGNNSTGLNSGGDTNSVVFTVLGRRLPSTLLSSTDDFETNNDNYGPVAGVTEVQIGTTPIGDGANGQTGLFLREQAPADSDASQGGFESLISPDVDTISFEYYDGTTWQTTWDTTTMGTRRLPSAVRVTYRMKDETEDRILVFAIPASDVTPDNPVQQETAS